VLQYKKQIKKSRKLKEKLPAKHISKSVDQLILQKNMGAKNRKIINSKQMHLNKKGSKKVW